MVKTEQPQQSIRVVMFDDVPAELARLAAEYGSVAEMARQLNFDRKNLHKMVKGKRPPSLNLLNRLNVRVKVACIFPVVANDDK